LTDAAKEARQSLKSVRKEEKEENLNLEGKASCMAAIAD